MKKSGVISVIVPVYKVEKYLAECIESILNQTYRELEVILVDDGSPDRCGEICDRYARMDSRILAVHQKNGGAAAARNAGLRIASGEYIAFVDGDDYLEPDAYEKLTEALICHDADIAQGNFKNIYTNAAELCGKCSETVSFSTARYLLEFTTDWACALSTTKLFRKHVLDQVCYEEGHCIDDEFFTYRAVMKAGKILCIPAVIFNYRQRASSIMKNRDTIEKKCEDIFAYLKKRKKDVAEQFPELKIPYENHYVDHLLWLATSDLGTKKTVRQIKKQLIRHYAWGKVCFWKKGQRKRFVRTILFIMTPAGMRKHREDGVKESGYELFE